MPKRRHKRTRKENWKGSISNSSNSSKSNSNKRKRKIPLRKRVSNRKKLIASKKNKSRKKRFVCRQKYRSPKRFHSSSSSQSKSSDSCEMCVDESSQDDRDLPFELCVPSQPEDDVKHRHHLNNVSCIHLKDCYPRSLHLLNIIDERLRSMIAAEILATQSSSCVHLRLAEHLNIHPSQISHGIMLDNFNGDIYDWAQNNLKPNNFTLIILYSLDSTTSHAVLIGKVILEEKEQTEIVLLDTQRNLDQFGEGYQYVYNIGRGQIRNYFLRNKFSRDIVTRFGLNLDIADKLGHLNLNKKC